MLFKHEVVYSAGVAAHGYVKCGDDANVGRSADSESVPYHDHRRWPSINGWGGELGKVHQKVAPIIPGWYQSSSPVDRFPELSAGHLFREVPIQSLPGAGRRTQVGALMDVQRGVRNPRSMEGGRPIYEAEFQR